MPKILVANTYFYPLDKKQWRFKKPYPPLGTLGICALLESKGYTVRFFDNSLNDKPEAIEGVLGAFQPDYFLVYDDGFNYLTKMCLSVMQDAAFAMANLAHEQGARCIINSSDSTDQFAKYLDHNFDYVVLGEGDNTVLSLLMALADKKEPSEVRGIAYRNTGGEIKRTGAASVLKDLNSLPIAKWSLVDMAAYRKIWLDHHGYFSLNVATTRGCPYKCNWCAKPIYGNNYNMRSPEHVLTEIEMLVREFQVDHFWFCDDIFGLKASWVSEFRKMVKSKGLRFKYMIQSRVDLLLKPAYLDDLAESGLETVWLGAESGSQHILDAMDKGIQIQQIFEVVPLVKSKGIRVALFIQFGYLGESKDDIQKTLDMILQLMPDEIGISVSYPLPGTKFYEKVKNRLERKTNWSDSDDLDPLYATPFSAEFYKKMHRYVHARFRTKMHLQKIQKASWAVLKKPLPLAKDMLSLAYNGSRVILLRGEIEKTIYGDGAV
ncbi:B12-binding domain-containing radical SAM protein [Marinilongibacter aquaticus]|uniref:B12-binding domain-containing radical SAM protein n=1 Tax=Marinilongibacter aquaticus TaxID=2975157 RepID=UPI0021BD8161|nr:radical SAM protein [Marinilongibacter aquaticus]UBM59290.1 B12-binding domain-containing radical SAM protein [Marinilongibacter aquaticus]